ncbi:MAG TPA: hypothetical protein VE177_02705 [Candidatus Binatus sp.]|nr:hypothetical protein [Candidatus Binatus sp.]
MSSIELLRHLRSQETSSADQTPPSTHPQAIAAKYVAHYAIGSREEARVLARQNSWNILEYLRSIGTTGASAGEISEALELPLSDVYSTLKELIQLAYTRTVPKKIRHDDRRKRFLCETVDPNRYAISEEFSHLLEYDEEMKEIVGSLADDLSKILSKIQKRLNDKRGGCPTCGLDHEVVEFLYALTLTALKSLFLRTPSTN